MAILEDRVAKYLNDFVVICFMDSEDISWSVQFFFVCGLVYILKSFVLSREENNETMTKTKNLGNARN